MFDEFGWIYSFIIIKLIWFMVKFLIFVEDFYFLFLLRIEFLFYDINFGVC